MDNLYRIDNNQWNMLVQDVSDSFDDGTIKRGYAYYRQGRVLHIAMSAPQQIEGIVEGNDNYKVEINLDFFTLSNCSCPVGGNCKHQFAILLEYARLQNRSVEMLVNAGQHVFSQPSPRSATTFAASVRKQQPVANKPAVLSAAELTGKGSMLAQMTIAQWQEWFALCTAGLEEKTRNGQYVQDSLKAIMAHKPPLSPVLEQLLGLNARLFVLQALTKPIANSSMPGHFYMGFFTNSAAIDLEKEIMGVLDSNLPIQAEPEQWDRVKETLAIIRRAMLVQSRIQQAAVSFYFQLWTEWLTPNMNGTALYEDELRELAAASEELGSELRQYPWLIARSWMSFSLSEDEKAWELLGTIKRSDGSSDDLFRFLHALIKDEHWDRLIQWLSWFGSNIVGLVTHAEQLYSHLWDEALLHRPDAEPLMWHTLKQRLPASQEAYEDKLLNYGKLREWMDFQMSSGREPLDYRVSEFADIERNDPKLLLPFYHQAVERYVLLKNRADYKQAVKLLKRLAKLYKKLKREDRWELFLNSFLERHSRLRALSEELRKGKLIP